METLTVLACDIKETKSIQPILHRFNEKQKLYLCTGPRKVGKTAFTLKILHALLESKSTMRKPVVISFDDTMDYWQKLFGNEVTYLSPFHNKREVALQEVIDCVEKELLQTSTNFILLDGLNNYAVGWDVEDFKKLISYLKMQAIKRQANIFITYRSRKEFFPYNLLDLKENDFVEFWNLERPEYFEKEFGETKLHIH